MICLGFGKEGSSLQIAAQRVRCLARVVRAPPALRAKRNDRSLWPANRRAAQGKIVSLCRKSMPAVASGLQGVAATHCRPVLSPALKLPGVARAVACRFVLHSARGARGLDCAVLRALHCRTSAGSGCRLSPAQTRSLDPPLDRQRSLTRPHSKPPLLLLTFLYTVQ